MVAAYIPERGDLIWLNFTPQAGREQAGKRPALVLSPKSYNQKTGRALVCPITSQVKDFPFEVALTSGLKVSGVVLADHVKNLDLTARQSSYIDTVDSDCINEVIFLIDALLND